MDVIIVSPNLDPSISLGGVSSVARFIVENNKTCNYIHFELGKRDAQKGGIARLLNLSNRFYAWKSLLKSNPSYIIHYNLPLSPASIIRDFFFMREARRQNRKMIVHVHGGIYMNSSHIPLALKRLLSHIFKWDVPFIVLSEHEKDVLSSRFSPKRVYVLPNCVELGYPVARTNDENVLAIGYLGRITEAKGMNELIEVCKVMQSKGVPFRLKIAGVQDKNTSYLESFEKILGNKFMYAGIVSGNAKEDFLNSIDIFVLPSYFEGLPMSLLESMSHGAIPVVTPVGSIPEVVKDGINGLLIKEHDVDSIVNAIIHLHKQEALRLGLSKAARTTIEEHYSPVRYFEKLNSIYQTV